MVARVPPQWVTYWPSAPSSVRMTTANFVSSSVESGLYPMLYTACAFSAERPRFLALKANSTISTSVIFVMGPLLEACGIGEPEAQSRHIGDDGKRNHERDQERPELPQQGSQTHPCDRHGDETQDADRRTHLADDKVHQQDDAEVHKVDLKGRQKGHQDWHQDDHDRDRLHEHACDEERDVQDQQ